MCGCMLKGSTMRVSATTLHGRSVRFFIVSSTCCSCRLESTIHAPVVVPHNPSPPLTCPVHPALVYYDEYSTGGSLVHSTALALPGCSSEGGGPMCRLTWRGASGSVWNYDADGLISRSDDGVRSAMSCGRPSSNVLRTMRLRQRSALVAL